MGRQKLGSPGKERVTPLNSYLPLKAILAYSFQLQTPRFILRPIPVFTCALTGRPEGELCGAL